MCVVVGLEPRSVAWSYAKERSSALDHSATETRDRSCWEIIRWLFFCSLASASFLPKYFSSEWSFCRIQVPSGLRYICAFGNRSTANTECVIGKFSLAYIYINYTTLFITNVLIFVLNLCKYSHSPFTRGFWTASGLTILVKGKRLPDWARTCLILDLIYYSQLSRLTPADHELWLQQLFYLGFLGKTPNDVFALFHGLRQLASFVVCH